MRKTIGLLVVLFFWACSNKPVPKPDQLLDEEVMENILFDLSILQATQSYMPNKLDEKGINPETFIYEKYKIDSTTYYQNKLYYASNTKKYKKIHKAVTERFNALKIEADSLSVKERIENQDKPKIKREILVNPPTQE
jgi:hypothetical protein